jgi:bifunctional enzyme CysN/CysC
LSQQATDKLDSAGAARNGAAFAFVTDQLSEEQEGSFTLDTAQACLRADRRNYTLIDTPGHRAFLKNMVTGATWADSAILVVDAAEGPRSQTYLHAYLIAMLGIRQVIVAVNKMDRVSYDRDSFEVLSRRLSAHLERIGIIPAAVVPISAQQGDHIVERSVRMPWSHTASLVETLDGLKTPRRDDNQPLRFVVQCLFQAKGDRAILGKVVSGRLQRGQCVVFAPGSRKTVATSVLMGQRSIDMATMGQCVGVFLQDAIPVARGCVGHDISHAPAIVSQFTARLFWVATRPLVLNSDVEVLCGTQSVHGHVVNIANVIDPVSLKVAEAPTTRLDDSLMADVTIRVDAPICIDPFEVVPGLGRVALLQDGRIAGGGITARR